jgi:6-phosphogluconolactonase
MEYSMKIRIFPNLQRLIKAAAELFLGSASDAIRQNGLFTIVLAGGATPQPLYEYLGSDSSADALDWSRVHFFWGDERCVAPDHPESNFRTANQAVLVPRAISPANIHRIQGELDPVQAASAYQEELNHFFQGSPPRFDLILLGMGSDGHTASLFPGTDVVSHPDAYQWVQANHVPQLDTWRITFTPRLINQAAKVVFLVSGADKAITLQHVLEGPYLPETYPSQLINLPSGNLIWLINSDAGSSLESKMDLYEDLP